MVDLTAAIAIDPKDALAYRFRSLAYAALNDNRHAVEDDATALRLNPGAR